MTLRLWKRLLPAGRSANAANNRNQARPRTPQTRPFFTFQRRFLLRPPRSPGGPLVVFQRRTLPSSCRPALTERPLCPPRQEERKVTWCPVEALWQPADLIRGFYARRTTGTLLGRRIHAGPTQTTLKRPLCFAVNGSDSGLLCSRRTASRLLVLSVTLGEKVSGGLRRTVIVRRAAASLS